MKRDDPAVLRIVEGAARLQASPLLLNGAVLSKSLVFGVGSPFAGVSYLLAFRAGVMRAFGFAGLCRGMPLSGE
ncbi:MAG TPA: hypothetical protein EYQ54_02905 [Myxococcales bacterium]|nr:hypothetical protein [Myxococcales bacterium]